MRCAVLVLLVACGGGMRAADWAGAVDRARAPALDMNDVSILLPLPRALDAPVITGLDEALPGRGRAAADAPLGVSPAAAAGDAAYLGALWALAGRYARAAELVRLTVIGQVADAAAFAWIFRGLDREGDGFVPMVIPGIAAAQQTVQLTGGDTVYRSEPIADVPVGFALATNGPRFAAAGYAVTRLASAPAVDLLAMLPGGDLLTGGGPTISRITPRGEVTTLPGGGFEQVRGLAYDAAGQRLFVIDHSVTVGLPDKLRVLHVAG